MRIVRGHLLAAIVVVVDTALWAAGHPGGVPIWGVPAYAAAATAVVALRYRAPAAGFVAAITMATPAGGAYALLLWAAYQAGRHSASRRGTAVIAGAALGGLAVQLAVRAADPTSFSRIVSTYVVFVALPLLAGRYLAQHDRMLTMLARHNRHLQIQRELVAERERLGERLRIARDMHDSLGHRLSLASVQAAALEVSPMPTEQRQAVRQLAGAVRGAMDELYDLVGALRGDAETSGRSPGADAIDALVAEFQEAGVPVTLRWQGEPHALSAAAGRAAYRVVEEGLTNAVKHAPERPVTVIAAWEADALLLTLVNPLPAIPESAAGGGHGLAGLAERVGSAGGLLDHGMSEGRFRLFAMVPVAVPEDPAGDDPLPARVRIRTVALGAAIAVLMFVAVPASMLLGVG
ncbi:hypothetical protein GCM10023194_30640 [Planotetraspora phitsanulokensis]|uniref:histidine kinase n=1 Tax=Planotetraspora phitsanulokensis TaxID=575192 RepID=A0A8J3TZB3_9ACTN|nr:histidine kinase [Planotetraspora phitsanulokensis]GII35798.1 hypothetical protein Pph01_08010 [Planotetraspora phitsanulokensis]